MELQLLEKRLQTLADVRSWLQRVDNPWSMLEELPAHLEQGAAELFGVEPQQNVVIGKNAASIACSWLRLPEEQKLTIMKIFGIAVMMSRPGLKANTQGIDGLFNAVTENFLGWANGRNQKVA